VRSRGRVAALTAAVVLAAFGAVTGSSTAATPAATSSHVPRLAGCALFPASNGRIRH